MDGLRKCLAEEFSSLYVLHLRGDIRKNMLSRGRAGEGENVFGQGSMTGTAISLLVKNPQSPERGRIFYRDIGDNLKRTAKLAQLKGFGSIAGIRAAGGWSRITPDRHGDWLGQRDDRFQNFLRLGSKAPVPEPVLFEVYSCGLKTQRDAWCYNPSKTRLKTNMARTVSFYNQELKHWNAAKSEGRSPPAITRDPARISWSRALESDLRKGKPLHLEDGVAMPGLYRPFTRQWLHYCRRLNEMVYRMPAIFPEPGLHNRVIAVTGIGKQARFSCLMTDTLPDTHLVQNGQCFPLYRYQPLEDMNAAAAGEAGEVVTAPSGRSYVRRSALCPQAVAQVRQACPEAPLTHEDVFHYLYGVLHARDYRRRFANNLSKELPRLPLMGARDGFEAFRDAGRRLAELHVNYESVDPYPVTVRQGDLRTAVITDAQAFYRVTKMKFGGSARDKDKSTVIYNANITLENIPLAAWDYEVNGKPALTWVMERQVVKTDRKSGLTGDANLYAVETVNNPAYPLELFQKVITVSLETLKIIRTLPPLEIDRVSHPG